MNKTIEDYVLQQKIGSGQYGNVYRAQHKINKQLYAVKVMNSDKFKQTPKLTEFTNNQIAILSKMTHPNIIKFIQMLRTTNNYYLVYEYCNGGTLAEYIKKKGKLTEQEALKILQQIRLAYEALYEAHILHRDIKPTNILFNNGLIKLADFGFCKQLLKENDMAQTMVGSPIYMAPEILKGLTYDSRADLWSIGVILYEMLYGNCPFEESSIPKLITLIDNNYLKIPNQPVISQNVKVLMMRLLTLKYKQRLAPLQFIKYDIGKINIEPQGQQNTYFSYREVGKYIRRALIYLTQTLDLITDEINNILFLRLAFMLCKIINSILTDTVMGGVYWQNLSITSIGSNWEVVIGEQQKLLKPYFDLTRQALARQDTSLKTKVELQTIYIDSRYFLQNIRKVQDEPIKFRLLNSFLFNKHFAMVIEKRPPEWNDFIEDGMPIKQKEQVCLKFARYY